MFLELVYLFKPGIAVCVSSEMVLKGMVVTFDQLMCQAKQTPSGK